MTLAADAVVNWVNRTTGNTTLDIALYRPGMHEGDKDRAEVVSLSLLRLRLRGGSERQIYLPADEDGGDAYVSLPMKLYLYTFVNMNI